MHYIFNIRSLCLRPIVSPNFDRYQKLFSRSTSFWLFISCAKNGRARALSWQAILKNRKVTGSAPPRRGTSHKLSGHVTFRGHICDIRSSQVIHEISGVDLEGHRWLIPMMHLASLLEFQWLSICQPRILQQHVHCVCRKDLTGHECNIRSNLTLCCRSALSNGMFNVRILCYIKEKHDI